MSINLRFTNDIKFLKKIREKVPDQLKEVIVWDLSSLVHKEYLNDLTSFLPCSLTSLVFNLNWTEILPADRFISSFLPIMQIQLKYVLILNIEFCSRSFSSLLICLQHCKNIEFRSWVISTPEPFEIPLIFSSNIEVINFGYYEWDHNPHILINLFTAIAKTSLSKGLKEIYFYGTSLSKSERLQVLKECGFQNIKIT